MEQLEPLVTQRPPRRTLARQRLELVSLLGEFTFVLKKTPGGHMHDLLQQAIATDPALSARTLTAMSHKLQERGELEAARYFLTQAMGCKTDDPTLHDLWRLLRGKLG